MTHEHAENAGGHSGHSHAKKAKTKCENCQKAECQCQSGCCGGACPHCTL